METPETPAPAPKEKPKAAPAKAAPPKAEAPKKAAKGKTAEDVATEKRLLAARASILKHTGKKDVQVSRSSLPYVPSGSFLLDHLIGGTLAEDGKAPVCPGYPRKHITELYGAEASGKTTAALEAVAEVQKLPGGSAMFIDFEHGLNQKYARSIGVSFDPGKLMFFQPDTMEEGWKMLLVGLKSGIDIIVVDSVAAMVPKDELEKDLEDAARIGAQARALSSFLPKLGTWLNNPKVSTNPKGTAIVLINQGRAVINTGPARGDNENTAGGKALKYYAYLRIKFTKIRGESIKRKNPLSGKEQSYQYGNHTQAKIIKSKIDGTAGHTTDIFIRYGQGIDNYYSLLEAAVSTRIVQRSGSTNKYGNYVAPSKDKFRDLLVANPALYEEIRMKTLAAVRSGEIPEPSDDDEIMELLEGGLGGGTSEGDDDIDTIAAETVEISDASDFTEDDARDQAE